MKIEAVKQLARQRSGEQAGLVAYVALAFGVIGIAWAAIFVRWAAVPGVSSAFWRLLIASAVLLPWRWRSGRRRQPIGEPRTVALAAVAGACFALDLAFWNTGLLYTSAASATLLANTAPVWVGLGTLIVFRERLSGWFWAGMAAALAGAGLILGRDLLQVGANASGVGGLLALVAGIFYGAYLLVTGRVREKLDTPTTMTLVTFAGTGVLFVAAVLVRTPLWGFSLQSWLALVGLGLVSQLGGVLLINYALGHLPATVVSVTLLAQPVLVALLGVLLLGEALTFIQIAGGVLVIGGIYLVHRLGR